MTPPGRLSPGDPNSYSRPEIAKVTHIHLKLEINFDQQILEGKPLFSPLQYIIWYLGTSLNPL